MASDIMETLQDPAAGGKSGFRVLLPDAATTTSNPVSPSTNP
jgi:hypothetical protein